MLKIQIILNDKLYKEFDCISIASVTTNGTFQILEMHTDSFFVLSNNHIEIKGEGFTKRFEVKNGMISFLDQDKATITCSEIIEI